MLDLVACRFSTVDSKLGVSMSNFTEPNTIALKQEVDGFHVVGEAQTLKKVVYPCKGEAPISNDGG